MLTINNIVKELGLNVKTISPFTNKTYLITDDLDNKYILKYTNTTQFNIYEYLRHFDCNVLYPIKKIKHKGNYYFLFNFLNQTYDNARNLPKLASNIKDIHNKTIKEVTLKKENLDNIEKIKRILNNRFTNLENKIRQIEVSLTKKDEDYIILSQYHVFLTAKNIMLDLESKIINDIKNNIKVAYVLNMAHPCLSHFKDNKIINYYKSYFGIVVSDIAKFYVESDHLDTNIFSIIDEWLSNYNNNFYKIYFKYLVLYIYMININIDTINNRICLINYIQISKRIKKIMYLFRSYN